MAALLLIVAATPANGQDAAPSRRDNAVYLELLGSGGLYSVNYERALAPALRMRVGVGTWTAESFWGDSDTRMRTFPVMLHAVPGGGAHHLEAAIGALMGHRGREVGESGAFVSALGLVGYRYEPPHRRFVLRVGFTPFYGFGDSSIAYPEEGFLPSLGLSFGARF